MITGLVLENDTVAGDTKKLEVLPLCVKCNQHYVDIEFEEVFCFECELELALDFQAELPTEGW